MGADSILVPTPVRRDRIEAGALWQQLTALVDPQRFLQTLESALKWGGDLRDIVFDAAIARQRVLDVVASLPASLVVEPVSAVSRPGRTWHSYSIEDVALQRRARSSRRRSRKARAA